MRLERGGAGGGRLERKPWGWKPRFLAPRPPGSRATSVPSLTTSLLREGKFFCPHVPGPM